MTCDCMMTCDILTPRHGSSWQHTAATHFSCTSQCKYFTFRRSYYGGFGQVYTLYYREQEECRSERVHVRAGMVTFVITSDEQWSYHINVPLCLTWSMFGWLCNTEPYRITVSTSNIIIHLYTATQPQCHSCASLSTLPQRTNLSVAAPVHCCSIAFLNFNINIENCVEYTSVENHRTLKLFDVCAEPRTGTALNNTHTY